MIQLQNILVPFDDASPSKMALRYGLSLAIQFHARLVAVHVVPTLAIFDTGNAVETSEIERLAVDDAMKSLSETVDAEFRDLVRFHPVVKVGDVREELLNVIDGEKIDLVVMGTHGRRMIERFFLGSTTEHILRKVPVPVLTVSHIPPEREIRTPGPVPIRRIVYAADLSDSMEIGMRYAAELARTFEAELKVLHVIDMLETGQWGVEVPGALPFDFTTVQRQAETRLREVLSGIRLTGVSSDITVIEGPPHTAIVRFADDAGADLLVLNLQNQGFLERVMLGATAERVIRGSHIPVLSIPAGTAASFMQTTFMEKAGIPK